MDEYIDFMVAPYALPKTCETLYMNGVKDFCVTQEDGDLHIRWKYDINRYIAPIPCKDNDGETSNKN